MLIAGAGGHAIEILAVLQESDRNGSIAFFDDQGNTKGITLFGKFEIITSLDDAREFFKLDSQFVLGVGKPAARKALAEKLLNAGGRLTSAISVSAFIGKEEIELGEGLNIMQGAVITQRTSIGKGTLVHIHCSVHHDTRIGEYCELSPGCRILGKATIGSFSSIGAGAIILPGISVGEGATVGAGAVVNKNVEPGATVVGVPAYAIK